MRVIMVLFYASFIIFTGLALIAFVAALSFNLIKPEDINTLIATVHGSFYAKTILTLFGFLLMVVSASFAQLILNRFQREKTIAFTTSSGEVTVALSAVEDLIKRLTGLLPEIRDLRPDVIVTKKGIVVDIRVVLRSEANIPELTARLQDITKSRIQEVLGVEEPIVIKIHIAKIASVEEKGRKKEIDKTEPPIPFGGYGRV
ncbi:MAG: alkaline shock response membrane anchor protein AmaP [Deltaproteobacteria bacterium]